LQQEHIAVVDGMFLQILFMMMRRLYWIMVTMRRNY
jgi:hypothetical protein